MWAYRPGVMKITVSNNSDQTDNDDDVEGN